MHRIGRKTQDGQNIYHNTMRYGVGEWWQSLSDTWYIVTSVEPGIAVDEYGDEIQGFFYTLRQPTTEELTERKRLQVEWDSLTADERIQAQLMGLAEALPGLDWGDFFS